MSGLLIFSFGGILYILTGLHQTLTPIIPFPSFPFPLLLSILSSLSSLLSLVSSFNHNDSVGLPLSISLSLISLLFLLYSVLLFFPLPFPSPAKDLVLLSAFALEAMYLDFTQRVSPDGIETRYLALLMVPVGVCAVCTGMAMFWPTAWEPKVGRGIGLVLHGTWLVQMGFSFFSDAIAHGCVLHQRSWPNYTVKCKSHHETHRGSALATLQFNCHLAFLVLVVLGFYSAMSKKVVRGDDYSKYRPLGVIQNSGGYQDSRQFTLDSDEDEEEGKKIVSSCGEIRISAIQDQSQEGGVNCSEAC